MLINCIINVYKINQNRAGSYIPSSNWVKTKNQQKNPIKKKDNKCFE